MDKKKANSSQLNKYKLFVFAIAAVERNNTLGFVLCASGCVTLLSWHIQFLAKGIVALFSPRDSYLNFYCFI